MIIIDTALEKLEKEGKPIRVGMVGAGFMAAGTALEIVKYRKGMRLSAIANRNQEGAKKAYEQAGVTKVSVVIAGEEKSPQPPLIKGANEDTSDLQVELDKLITDGKYVVTSDAMLLCKSSKIDVILEMTGSVEFGARVAMEAIKNKKHFVSFNAELFGTLGSILKYYADSAGVIFTLADGDQPVAQMNLYRFVKGLGARPVLCGNIKGFHDPYRNPTTQEGFAKKWGQNVYMVTSFADGSKISFEQAVVANATGMGVLQRGMIGPTVEPGSPIEKSVTWYPTEKLLKGKGVVDYAIGAAPGPGVFVLGTIDDPVQKHYLNLYKLGEGPLYCFYTSYHLCHFEVPNTIARAVIFGDSALSPMDKPYVDVITAAKRNLKTGEVLDQLGGYDTYGLCESYGQARKENLLPIGLAEGSTVKRNIKKDEILTFEDVVFPKDRLSLKLWEEQIKRFPANEL